MVRVNNIFLLDDDADQSNTLINLSLRLQVPKQQLKHIFSEISSISQKEIERTNKIDKYMKRQHKYLHYYSKIREIQASNIELRLEELFLSWVCVTLVY